MGTNISVPSASVIVGIQSADTVVHVSNSASVAPDTYVTILDIATGAIVFGGQITPGAANAGAFVKITVDGQVKTFSYQGKFGLNIPPIRATSSLKIEAKFTLTGDFSYSVMYKV